MDTKRMLNAVTDEKIQFVTAPSKSSVLPTTERRIIITGPPELLPFLSLGDPLVLDELIALLPDPYRGWAAEVVLASLTHHDEDVVNAFAAQPRQWQATIGGSAQKRWKEWLEPRRARLAWHSEAHAFVENR